MVFLDTIVEKILVVAVTHKTTLNVMLVMVKEVIGIAPVTIMENTKHRY